MAARADKRAVENAGVSLQFQPAAQCVELVADRASKEPFDADLKLNARVKAEGMKRGLICYPGGGTTDGMRGDHVMVSPPFIVTETQVTEIVELLGDVVDAALAEATR